MANLRVIFLLTMLMTVSFTNSTTKQERLRQIQRRRKEMSAKYAEERKKTTNVQELEFESEGQLSKTQKMKDQERQKYVSNLKEMTRIREKNKDFVFETVSQMNEFVLNIPEAQKVGMNIKIYVIEQNEYRQIKDVERQAPLRIFIYENNNRIVVQETLYFQGALIFQAQKDSTYTIRFYNSGKIKLIQASYNGILETQHIDQLINADDAKDHGDKAKNIQLNFKKLFAEMKTHNLITVRNGQEFNKKVKYYFVYQIIELLICCGVCFTQLAFIKKALRGRSII